MKTKKTPEEIKSARNAASKRWYEKQKAAKMAQNGGAGRRRGRPPKSASAEVKAETKNPARKVAKHAVCATGKKACKCGPKCECKELKKLEKSLVKADTAYHKATAKAAAARAAAKAAKALVKEIKLAVKAQKAAIKASHKKRRGGIGDLDSAEA